MGRWWVKQNKSLNQFKVKLELKLELSLATVHVYRKRKKYVCLSKKGFRVQTMVTDVVVEEQAKSEPGQLGESLMVTASYSTTTYMGNKGRGSMREES